MLDSTQMTVTHNAMTGAIRALSMDAVQKANSGHPGMPMGMADVATILFSKFLKFDPARPDWPDRDRFVLSAGHGSMLLYSLLYLTGYARPTIDDIKAFRQLGSPCAGHPEVGELPGIECTTGPLGQGLGMAVGMALAERMQAARYGDDIVDHHTYVIAGDGCLMEGISHEAMSMAGHLKLGKLILLWDDNSISIDGATDLTVSDDQGARFQAHGWHTLQVDGHDPAAIETAIEAAHGDARPTLIACKTIIGYGAPNKQGTAATHGAPLGDDEIAATREALDWPHAPFDIPADILEGWRQIGRRSQDDVAAWQARLEAMEAGTRTAFEAGLTGIAPDATFAALDQLKRSLATNFENGPQKVATRKASQMALEVINGACQITIGGSADLTGSNNTNTSQTLPISADDFSGRYIYYGVREFAMGTVMNGMALHGGFIPYGGTFMVFTDYARPAIRLSALMGQGVIYVMTHDSIGLGEDGPTHQPVEHLASLRAMPGLNVLRPADVVETAEAWEVAIKDRTRPTIIALSRQGLAQVRGEYIAENKVACGGYVLKEASGVAQVTLIATGSEVGVALDAQTTLEADGIATRVVSMPSTGHFDAQEPAYRDEVLGTDTLKVSIEAGATFGWHKYVGADGITIGIDSFGGSAPAPDLYEHFGITAARVVSKVTKRIK